MIGSSSKPHLKHLLNQDQEPFVLINYINDKRSQRAKTPVPVPENPRFSVGFSGNLLRHSCLFSLPESPDQNRTYSSKFGATPKSVFVHIPPETAALLLEAALRIERSEKSRLEKSKSVKKVGFALFGSILKKIKRRKKNEKTTMDDEEEQAKDVSEIVSEKREDEQVEVETTLGLEDEDEKSSINSRISESTEAKFIDIENTETTSASTSNTNRSQENEFIVQEDQEAREFNSEELVSPVTSPARRKNQVAKNEEESLNSDEKEQKEEKEHFSPISVLDLDVDGQDQEDEDDSELERSFAFVQKAKHKLLRRLRRFERLAELNPLELEKRIDEDEDKDDEESEDEDDDTSLDSESSDTSIAEVLNTPNSSNQRRVLLDTKRLVIALMREDGALTKSSKRVLKSDKLRKRLNSLKNIERNTINMMVQMDFRAEQNEWQKNREHVEETVIEIEVAVFSFLVEELSAELVYSNNVTVY